MLTIFQVICYNNFNVIKSDLRNILRKHFPQKVFFFCFPDLKMNVKSVEHILARHMRLKASPK